MTLPFLTLTGSAYEQGVQHGRDLRDDIARNLEVYFDRFESEGRLSRSEALRRGTAYARVIEEANPDYYSGMLGIAEGSGHPLEEVATLNVRYEILYYQFGINALHDGCTAFAISPEFSSNGHLLLGQNWDWIPDVKGAVIRSAGPHGPGTLSFTEAGIFGGKIGLNSTRLGLTINGLNSTADDWSRLRKPFHVRCYEILRSTDLDAAVEVLTTETRSCSTNFLIGQAGLRAIDIEVAPETVRFLEMSDAPIIHSNHFLDPSILGVEEPPIERLHSRHRFERFRELTGDLRPISIEDLQRFLRDHKGHPNSVCRHEDPTDPPEERYRTVTSVIMDLEDREIYITDGPPCAGEYRKLGLS